MSKITASPDRLFLSSFACVTLVVVVACAGNSAAGSPASENALVYPLHPSTPVVKEVQPSVPGLTPTQTAQGMGAVLYYAQQSMQPGDFAKVASAFPGSERMINEGTKLGMPSEMYGLTSLSGSLKNIGISPTQFSQLVPAMTEVVSYKSGPEVAEKFAAVFRS
jgi:hypothetical protein